MMNNDINQRPIIILGMHRSGTTMLTQILQDAGLFIGSDLEQNYESWFFLKHNDWLLRQAGATWYNPTSITWITNHPKINKLNVEYLDYRIQSVAARQYLGWKRYIRGQRLGKGLNQPWGWKDPRTTFTFPIWKEIFPQAKIIHIYRNGIPVAASLRKREQERLQRSVSKFRKQKESGIFNILPKGGGFTNGSRCLDLDLGFSLWEEYINRADAIVQEHKSSSISIKYEDFLDNPQKPLKNILNFCNLESSNNFISEACKRIKPQRSRLYIENTELIELYKSKRSNPTMIKFGYENEL